MNKHRLTYRISAFIVTIFLWELVFWLVVLQLLNIFGFFDSYVATEKLSFLYPKYAWLNLCVIPLLISVFVFQIVKRNKLVKQFENVRTSATFMSPVSTLFVFVRYFLIRNAIVFIIFAMMQPVLGTRIEEGKAIGIEMIFAVDVSNSMNTRDISNGDSRLKTAKRMMNQIINQSATSQVGLMIFAGNAYPQLPLTGDLDMFKMYIDDLNTSLISNQGTNVAAVLTETSQFFSKNDTKKVLILITDGEDHEGGIKEAFEAYKGLDVEVFVIGIGSEKGGIVPRSGEDKAPSLRDEMGQVVISKVNLSILKEIADGVGGTYFLTDDAFPDISQILTQINSKSGVNDVDLRVEVKDNRYVWPLSLALIFLTLLWLWEIPSINRYGV